MLLHRNLTSPPSLWPGRELRKYHYPCAGSSLCRLQSDILGWHESLFLFGKSRRAARIAPCTVMYLVNDIQFSRFRLWVFLACVLYRFQRASNRDGLCYFASTNSASSARHLHNFLCGNVSGEWNAVFKISVIGFSYLHIVPIPKGFQQGLVVPLLLHN